MIKSNSLIKSIFFYVASSLSVHAYDGPLSGTLVGEGGGLLNYECVPNGYDQASCTFVQVLFSRGDTLSNEDYWSFLQDIDTICELSKKLESYIEGEVTTFGDDTIPFTEQDKRNQGELRDFEVFSQNFCETQSEDDFQKFIAHLNDKAERKCTAIFNDFSQTIRRVSDRMWVVASQPEGACAVIQTSHFEKDEKFDFLWKYMSSKLVKNRAGENEIGISCSMLDESAIEYTSTKPITLNCETLK